MDQKGLSSFYPLPFQCNCVQKGREGGGGGSLGQCCFSKCRVNYADTLSYNRGHEANSWMFTSDRPFSHDIWDHLRPWNGIVVCVCLFYAKLSYNQVSYNRGALVMKKRPMAAGEGRASFPTSNFLMNRVYCVWNKKGKRRRWGR